MFNNLYLCFLIFIILIFFFILFFFLFFFFFFFSSRRRHTRFDCDWSSDVCSSDLAGADATEQCVVIADVNFLNNADLEGKQLPPAGAPNIMLASGGTQLRGDRKSVV